MKNQRLRLQIFASKALMEKISIELKPLDNVM